MLRFLKRWGIWTAILLISLSGDVSSPEAGSGKVFVKAPTPCHRLERVEGNRVYLRSGPKDCPAVSSKLTVEIDRGLKKVAVYVDGTFWEEQAIGEFGMKDINEYLGNEDRLGGKIKVPENIHAARGRKEARKTLEFFQSEEFRKKHEAEIERLKTTVFRNTLDAYYRDAKKDGKRKPGMLPDNERIYLFVSSSMPIRTLRNYARDLDRIGDPNVVMVMRGFVGGMKRMKPTLDFTREILAEDADCDIRTPGCRVYRVDIKIDPLLFRRYDVNRVPTAVYVPNIQVTDFSLSEGMEGNVKAGDHYALNGDASLNYILETFRKESGRHSIDPLLESLKGGIYRQERKR